MSPADEVKIVDEEDKAVPEGVFGELLSRGPYTIDGYYMAEEANKKSFTPDGFYRTGDKSYVELLFTGVDGRDYLVHRDTRALRAVGDKPAAMTKDSVNLADLSDKTVTKGAREVNSRVEALTGFDRESFIRVSILPQGEFDKFLNQNSAERRETLRNIFGTELYESYADVVQSWLKTAGKQADRASDACSALMNRTFETVGEKYPLCDCDEYAARIDELESSCAERKKYRRGGVQFHQRKAAAEQRDEIRGGVGE